MNDESETTALAWGLLAGGVLGMGSSFVFLGSLVLGEVVAGAIGFVLGALLAGGGLVRLVRRGALAPRPASLLVKLARGAGLAGVALSVLMIGVSFYTGAQSKQLGILSGASGVLAGLILLGAAALCRGEPPVPPEDTP
ncbi:MAG: hypothetical protein JKY65_11980 [Planctomycetes bacterium]|nr:hypothetical protein [Planctomycetota bacterium]